MNISKLTDDLKISSMKELISPRELIEALPMSRGKLLHWTALTPNTSPITMTLALTQVCSKCTSLTMKEVHPYAGRPCAGRRGPGVRVAAPGSGGC